MPPFDPFAAPPDNSTPVPGVGTSLTPAQAAALPAAVAAKNAATAAQQSAPRPGSPFLAVCVFA